MIIAAAVLGVAGCGGDDAPITSISTQATTPTTAASAEDFIADADARCAEANAAIANLSTGTEVTALSAGQQLEITSGLLEGLQALGPPDDPTGSLDAYFAALEDQIVALEEQESAAAGGDTATVTTLVAELDAAQSEALDAAFEFGFDECGQEGTTLPESSAATGSGTATTPSGASGAVAPVAPVTPAPTTTAPVAPVEPAPVPEVPAPTGGTGAGGTGSTPSTGSTGGGTPAPSGGTGGIGPG